MHAWDLMRLGHFLQFCSLTTVIARLMIHSAFGNEHYVDRGHWMKSLKYVQYLLP